MSADISNGRLAQLLSPEITTTEGAPLLRSLQGWEPPTREFWRGIGEESVSPPFRNKREWVGHNTPQPKGGRPASRVEANTYKSG